MPIKKPQPFRRPSATLSDPAKRVWATVELSAVRVGDIMPGFGKVDDVSLGDEGLLRFQSMSGQAFSAYPEVQVLVFLEEGRADAAAHARGASDGEGLSQ
jgi:hypothetical protein